MKIGKGRFHIVLAGCGGTGSYVFYYLSRLMFTELAKDFSTRTTCILVDGDDVENKNLLRQNFIENDVGRNKALVLAERYSNAYGIHVEYSAEMLTNPERLIWLLNYTSHDYLGQVIPVLVGCVDNHLARQVMHKAFLQCSSHLIYIDAGNSEKTGQVVIGVKGCAEITFVSKQKVFAAPAGSVLPCLLEEEAPQSVQEGLSCADLTLLDGQSIMANMATANLVNMALNAIINHHRVPFHMAATDILTGETKSSPGNN